MDNALTIPVTVSLQPAPPRAVRLLSAFLSGKSAKTIEAYRQDVADFASFLGLPTQTEAAERLLGCSHGEANELALNYRAFLLGRKLSPATVNRRLAALRSVSKLARRIGFIPWAVEVDSVKAEAYRDTRGCGLSGYRAMLGHLSQHRKAESPKLRRDMAILRLLHDLGLRRSEVTALDVDDYDPAAGTLSILGKGRREKETLTVPPQTAAVLSDWLSARGCSPGPLFVSFDHRAGESQRLTGKSVHKIVKTVGRAVGIEARPHGLRHSAITEALDATNGNYRTVARFSRHRDIRVLMRYDDNRQDLGGDVAKIIAARV